ncbi:unnamed protein product [Caenorhabditis sp. 36 PRJEB53466]|nr:unnamed protein product [Caenorhabditis sp. 36 PRJEB53466]
MEYAEKLESDVSADPSYQKPPLFGIPVNIKESIYVKHMDRPSETNSTSVDQLIHLGAVPFVHTNIPFALLSFGCTNPVYGSTNNP